MSTTRNALVIMATEALSFHPGAAAGGSRRSYRIRGLWFKADELLNSLLIVLVLSFSATVPLLQSFVPVPQAMPAAVATGTFVTTKVIRGDLSVKVSATGTVEPVRLIEVSSELSGNVKAVYVDNNDRVKVGQLLAELNAESLTNERARAAALVAAAKARIAEAKAGVQAAAKDFARKSTLAKSKLTTERDLDLASAAAQQSKASVEALKSELAIAEANLRIADENLGRARILSPIDGIVLRRNVEPGQTVAASLQAPVLFRLAQDLNRMQIRVDVDEADALNVRDGQAAKFAVQALRDQMFEAKVEKLYTGPEIIQGVVTYKAILSFDNSELKLKPGMTATAEIVVATVRDKLLVPNSALRFSPPDHETSAPEPLDGADLISSVIGSGRSFADNGSGTLDPAPIINRTSRRVFIEKAGALQPVVISIGATDGMHTQILSGPLKEGQTLVVDLASSGG